MRTINLFLDLSSRGPFTFYTGVCISGPIAAHNSLGTCNSLLMSWQFLLSFYRHPPIFRDPWFWHGIQLAQGCNHLAGLYRAWRRILADGTHSFHARLHVYLLRAESCRRDLQLAILYKFFFLTNNKHRDWDSNCSFDFIAVVKS